VWRPLPAAALDPERAMSQYLRDRWSSDNGYPGGPVHAIAQTPDGYLWIAGDKGLVRFDGFSFRLFNPAGATPLRTTAVLGIVANDDDGSLWLRLQGPSLLRYSNGRFENLFAVLELHDSVITAMARGHDGATLLAALGSGAAAYRVRGSHAIAAVSHADLRSSFVLSIAETPASDLLLGTRDAGLLHVRGDRVTAIADGLADDKINCLLADAKGDVWIGTDNGVVRWSHGAVTAAGLPSMLSHVRALALGIDRDANTWIGTGSDGLLRVTASGVASLDRSDVHPAVTAVFEDRDGNLWVGTSAGIERWRDSVFTTYSTRQGLPSDAAGPVYVDGAQRTWFGPPAGGLYWMRDGQTHRITEAGLAGDVVYSISGIANEVWVGRQRGGLTRLRVSGDTVVAERFTEANGLAQNNVYAVHAARDGAVWAGTLSAGVSRWKSGAFTTFTRADGLASNTVTSIAQAQDDAMWFATPNGVSVLAADGWRRYTAKDGLPSNEVNGLLCDSTGIMWAATAAGLAAFENGAVRAPLQTPAALRGSILGIADDRAGALWITTPDRVLRIDRARLLQGSLADGGVREFGYVDGLLSLEGVKRHRSVTTDDRGRVWLSLTHGLSMADAVRPRSNARPALVHVEDVAADSRSIDSSNVRQIPAGSRRITLSFTGISLAVPDRVSFRYRLDGFDRDWSAPATTRQAVYTNLTPGPYIFRVVASNADGVFNSAEATMPFQVLPQFWQTVWFRLGALLTIAAAAWALYRMHVRRVARQLNARFEERLAERTRIAQELHDTLLQGFVSASMQLHVAGDRLPEDSPVRPSIERVLDLMRRVIEDGRNAVRGLRSSASDARDLEQAFSRIAREMPVDGDATYRVIVEGRARPLNPIIRDEVYRIGREALMNAFRHSRARLIELELEYAAADLRLLVRDDGTGIDPDVVRSGSDGHWGLAGMRERAERIGASFKVWSRGSAGTEIELLVPARAAYSRTENAR